MVEDLNSTLLSPALLQAVQGLDLVSRTRRKRAGEGIHPASRHGREEDFFQHRPYVRGDDLRAVDWRASARTGHLLLKERHQPSRRPLTLLLDTSASMGFPREGPASKLRQAKVLAAALAFLALRRGDSVEVSQLRGSRFERIARLRPATRALHAVSGILGPLQPSGEGEVAVALDDAQLPVVRHGLVVVLSDLYGDETRLLRALASLRRLSEVAIVHVLSAAERAIPPGTTSLEELEGGRVVRLEAASIRAHAERVAAWSARLQQGALSAGAEWVPADAAEEPAGVLVRWLRRAS